MADSRKTTNLINGEKMDIWYFDWSDIRGVVVLLNDASWFDYKSLGPLHNLIQLAKPGDMIIGESTFSSFNINQRYRDIQEAKMRKLLFRTVPTRQTPRWRQRAAEQGLIEKEWAVKNRDAKDQVFEDVMDIIAIRLEAKSGTHLKIPRVLDPDDPIIGKRERANEKIMQMRRDREYTEIKKGNWTFVSAKDRYAEKLIAQLPDFKSLPANIQNSLGSGNRYSKTIVAAVGVIAEEAVNTKEFDSLSGLFVHGYGSMLRSELMYHGWNSRRDKITLTDYHRNLRWLFHHIRAINMGGES